jgi:enoyl-CoA hydratase
MTSTTPAVRSEKNGPVTTVILSRPERRNAVDQPTARALADAFLAFERDPDAKVGVLFGDHGAFCAGADLKAVSSGTGNRMLPPRTGDAWDALADDGPMGPSRMLLSTRWPAVSSSRSGATCASSRRTPSSASSAVAGACR